MRLPRVRFTVKGTIIAAAVAWIAALALCYGWPRGFTVRVVNRTNGTMTCVRLELGGGRRVDLPPIPPGQSSGAVISNDEASNIHMVYVQPDGVTNDLVRVRYPREALRSRENKVVLGVMSHMTGGKPLTMKCYVKRRKLWDLALYVPNAPGGED